MGQINHARLKQIIDFSMVFSWGAYTAHLHGLRYVKRRPIFVGYC